MTYLVLGAKVGVAVILAVAGGAKLSDIQGFSTTVRLFLPRWLSESARLIALTLAVAELLLGMASLSSPAEAWPNLLVLAAACGFMAVSAFGYAFYRGRSCNCFGALSARTFDAIGMLRSGVIVTAASLALLNVPRSMVALDLPARVLLLGGSLLLALVSFTAARSLALSRTSQRRLTA